MFRLESPLCAASLLVFVLLTSSAVSQSQSYRYALTENAYTETDNLDALVIAEFGAGAVLADWDDIVANFTGTAAQFCDAIGLPNYQDSAMCMRTGSRWWSSTRHYFLERHDGTPPPGFLAHDNLDNFIVSLGSWYGMSKKVLAKVPIQISVANLSPGLLATAKISHAAPGEFMILAYSLVGPGPTSTPFGFTLALSPPILRAPLALVNTFGEVTLNQPVPPRVPLGTPIWMQAVEILSAPPPPGTPRFRLSNGLAATIQ